MIYSLSLMPYFICNLDESMLPNNRMNKLTKSRRQLQLPKVNSPICKHHCPYRKMGNNDKSITFTFHIYLFSLYLSIILGSNLNLSLMNKNDKYRYKHEYEKFKMTVTYVLLVTVIISYFLPTRFVLTNHTFSIVVFSAIDAVCHFLMVWYYCTLTIRESILRINGSRFVWEHSVETIDCCILFSELKAGGWRIITSRASYRVFCWHGKTANAINNFDYNSSSSLSILHSYNSCNISIRVDVCVDCKRSDKVIRWISLLVWLTYYLMSLVSNILIFHFLQKASAVGCSKG